MILRSLLVVSCAGALAACHSAKSDWARASAENTVAAYRWFLERHPEDAHRTDARRHIEALQDAAAWNSAQVASSVPGFETYLSAEPTGAHAAEARDQITQRERAAAWARARQANTPEALQAFLEAYPNAPQGDEARATLRALTAYRVQLATEPSRQRADHERRALARRFGDELPLIVVLDPDPTHRAYRVATVPMSREAASAACSTVERAHESCRVVPAGADGFPVAP